MCGITGVYAYNMIGRMHFVHLENATRVIESRGPDYHDSYHDNTVALGHRRLSIIDTSSSGHQPMHDATGRYLIIYNGEIFNYRELKKNLVDKGYSFNSETDTEVLLNLYIAYGKECLNKVNGFFSFAIYDKEEKTLFLARDRMGIKPLYYFHDGDKFLFGSEIKSLLKYGIPKEIDYESLWQYLQMNYISAPKTIFKGIKKLEPGHYYSISPEKIESAAYYTIPYDPQAIDKSSSYEQLQKRLFNLMEDSVQQRLVADVPLGTFLSGGIDSSVITMLAARHKPDIHSFSIGYKDLKFFDETDYARSVAKKAGIEHTVFEISSNDLLGSIEGVLDYLDEPFADSSALAVNILCRETKKHATVALSGDGADELFGGYNKHEALKKLSDGGLLMNLIAAGQPLWYMLPKSRHNKLTNLFRQLHRMSEGMKLSPAERYWRWASFATEKSAFNLLSSQSQQLVQQNAYAGFKSNFTGFIKNDLNTQLLADCKMVLPDDMLIKVDRMSMLNSLEIRVPFLDYRIVDFAYSLPEEYKIGNGIRKRIVQDTFKEILPAELYNRPKKGFEVPLLHWLRNDLKEKITDDLLKDDFIAEQGIFDVREVRKLKKKLFSMNPGDVHARIWGLLVFQWWYRRYFS